jgi:hypothetical protein
VAVCASGLLSCNELVVPEGPDLSQIDQLYEEPKGILNEENIQEIVENALVKLQSLENLGKFGFVIDTLENVNETIKSVATADDGSILKISGSTDVASVCPGPGAKATTASANGNLTYTITFDRSKIGEVVWGSFNDCVVAFGENVFTINSSMDIYLGGEIPLSDLDIDTLLFRLDGGYTRNDEFFSLAFDFRVRSDEISIRVPALDGDVIFTFGLAVAIETREGSFCCDFENRTCFQLEGDSCEGAIAGDLSLSW